MVYRGAFGLISALIQYRWARFAIAALPLVIGIIFVISAFGATEIKTMRGVHVSNLYVGTDSSTGAYVYDRVTLVGSSSSYYYVRTDFSPALTEDTVANSDSVDIWYDDSIAYSHPEVLAIQIHSTGGTSTKYVTQAYLHPENGRNDGLKAAAIPLGIGLAFVLWGLLAPPIWRRKPVTTTT